MTEAQAAEELLGIDLAGYRLVKLTEVYKTEWESGRKTQSLGYFRDPVVAAAFAQNQTDAPWHRTNSIIALVSADGKTAFIVNEQIELMDDEQAALSVREAALAKLSPEERKVLGV